MTLFKQKINVFNCNLNLNFLNLNSQKLICKVIRYILGYTPWRSLGALKGIIGDLVLKMAVESFFWERGFFHGWFLLEWRRYPLLKYLKTFSRPIRILLLLDSDELKSSKLFYIWSHSDEWYIMVQVYLESANLIITPQTQTTVKSLPHPPPPFSSPLTLFSPPSLLFISICVGVISLITQPNIFSQNQQKMRFVFDRFL